MRWVAPWYDEWNDVPEANRNGTPASAAIALAVIVLPVPGPPWNRIPRRVRPPIRSANRLVVEEQLQGPDHLVLDRVDADHVVQPDVDLLGPVDRVRRAPDDRQRDQSSGTAARISPNR